MSNQEADASFKPSSSGVACGDGNTNFSPVMSPSAASDPSAQAIAVAVAVAAALAAAWVNAPSEPPLADGKKNKRKKASANKNCDEAIENKKAKKGPNFSQAEVDNMLELIEEAMPLSISQWEAVADEHRIFWPESDCDGERLCRKFNLLANRKIPTGDPFIPP